MLSLAEYSDVPEGHKYYGAVQIATLYRLIEPVKYPVYPKQRISTPSKEKRVKGVFGVDRPVSEKEFSRMLEKMEVNSVKFREGMTRGEAVYEIIRETGN